MAADRLAFPIANRKQLQNQIIACGNALLDLMNRSQAINDIIAHDINGGDFSALDTELGISGAGANFATLHGNLNDILNVNTVEVTAANRIARLKEYVGRIAGQ